MKLKLEKPQRVVEYYGLKLIVPHDTKFLITCDEGIITAHSDKPWTEPGYFEGYELGEVAKIIILEGFDWRDSLQEYKPENLI